MGPLCSLGIPSHPFLAPSTTSLAGSVIVHGEPEKPLSFCINVSGLTRGCGWFSCCTCGCRLVFTDFSLVYCSNHWNPSLFPKDPGCGPMWKFLLFSNTNWSPLNSALWAQSRHPWLNGEGPVLVQRMQIRRCHLDTGCHPRPAAAGFFWLALNCEFYRCFNLGGSNVVFGPLGLEKRPFCFRGAFLTGRDRTRRTMPGLKK